jgi:hypothetical protein
VLNQHCNVVTSWAIDTSGEIKRAYAQRYDHGRLAALGLAAGSTA